VLKDLFFKELFALITATLDFIIILEFAYNAPLGVLNAKMILLALLVLLDMLLPMVAVR
jgi:hypothetical protein